MLFLAPCCLLRFRWMLQFLSFAFYCAFWFGLIHCCFFTFWQLLHVLLTLLIVCFLLLFFEMLFLARLSSLFLVLVSGGHFSYFPLHLTALSALVLRLNYWQPFETLVTL